jgi:hypothetical protein
VVLTIFSLLTGCASSPVVRMPQVTDALRTPPDQVLFLVTPATGVQIYRCAATQGPPPRFQWVFEAPEADLFDSSGHKIGRHFAGPTWESSDGSKVVGEVKAKNSPDPASIPWLLLSAKSVEGKGVFARTKSIQRLQTAGGKAPAESCEPDQVQQEVRVPYKATYYFYSAP